jgi:hypothetical protein
LAAVIISFSPFGWFGVNRQFCQRGDFVADGFQHRPGLAGCAGNLAEKFCPSADAQKLSNRHSSFSILHSYAKEKLRDVALLHKNEELRMKNGGCSMPAKKLCYHVANASLSSIAFAILRAAMKLFSIGHSNIEIETFVELLRRHDIDLLADTRSQPYSRYTPHFNREPLQSVLARHNITYLHLGAELGGRPAGSAFYFANGKVDYDLLAAAPFYLAGIERLLALAEENRVAFMCSEADYKHCHRYWLITRTLVARGIAVEHILSTGETATSTAVEFEPEQPSLF